MNETKKKKLELCLSLEQKLAKLDQQSTRNPGKLFRVHAILMMSGAFATGFVVAGLDRAGNGHFSKLKVLSRLLFFG